MARYKSIEHNSLLLRVVLSEQIIPGSFAFAPNYLVDHELDLKPLGAEFQQFGARHFGSHKVRLARFIHAMNGKDALSQIDADGYDSDDFPSQVS